MKKEVRIKNERGLVKIIKYDERGNEIENISSDKVGIRHKYDSENRLMSSIITSGDLVRKYLYNEEGLLVKILYGELIDSEGMIQNSGSINYIYYNDKLIIEKNTNGDMSTFQYNEKGDIILETSIKNEELINIRKFIYNYEDLSVKEYYNDEPEYARIIKYNKKIGGDIIYSKDKIGGVEYWREYDEKGLLLKIKENDGCETDYEYNEKGDLIKVYTNDGYIKNNYYNDDRKLIRTEHNKGYWVNYEYNERGDIIKSTRSDESFVEYEYDYYE